MAANRFTVEDVADSSDDESLYPCQCCGIKKCVLMEYYRGRITNCKKCTCALQNLMKYVKKQNKNKEMKIWKIRFPSELNKLIIAFKESRGLRRRGVPFNFDRFFRAYDDKPEVLGTICAEQSGGRRRFHGKTDLKGRLAGLSVEVSTIEHWTTCSPKDTTLCK